MGAVRGDGLLREDGCGGDVLVPMSYVLVISVFKVEGHPENKTFLQKFPHPGLYFKPWKFIFLPSFEDSWNL